MARRLEHSWIGPEHVLLALFDEPSHRPEAEHFLLSMTYSEYAIAPLLHRLGSSEQDLLEALARRGVRVPEVDPPLYRPWRGHQRIEVTEAELRPVLDVLTERHPPGSEWRRGFNWLPDGPAQGALRGPGSTARRASISTPPCRGTGTNRPLEAFRSFRV